MPETDFSYSQLEAPAAGAVLSQGRHTLRGWVWPKTGGHFVDVRARLGDRIFPGVHGLPRPDLAAHFQTRRPVALAEFYVVVDLHPGPAMVVLEALEIEGRWRAFQQFSVQVEPCDAPVHFAVPGGPLRWIDYGHGLRLLLRELGRRPAVALPQLAAELAADLPINRVLRDAPAPLIGFVDEPAAVCSCRFGRIPAFGHLFHPELAIRRVLATVDLQAWQTLQIGQPSPGPAAHYAAIPNARECGFTGLVDVPAQLPNPVSLRIYAELADGSLQLGPVIRTRLHPDEVDKHGLRGRTGLEFAGVLTAWDDALTARGFNISRDDELNNFLNALRVEFSTSAPAHESTISTPVILSAAALPRRLLLATHGLSLQGAPRFLLELAQTCAAAGAEIDVVSAEDGPLRAAFAALGATVTLVECTSVLHAASEPEALAAITDLLPLASWAEADLVVANSFTTFWAVHAAKAAGKPVLFYVHESTTPRLFYDRRISASAVALAESAFATADAVSFTTAATRHMHLDYGRPERFFITPGWADLARLDRWLKGQDRAALRRALGVGEDERLVCNIGTISDRKGQHTFVRAIDLLRRRHPALAAKARIILLGGRDSPFDAMLADTLADLALPTVEVHPETTDYLRYYLAADVFVCSSYEESSPRVIFEAMACGTPILASAVHGIPELVRHELEALLCPPGDTVAWCDALARLLASPALADDLARRARARAENTLDVTLIMPRHLALMGAAAQCR
jgi:glycosyltransferase involved in cell wall biosynthesis